MWWLASASLIAMDKFIFTNSFAPIEEKIRNIYFTNIFWDSSTWMVLQREKCPNMEFFLVRIFLYSVRIIRENTDQKKIRIWTLFTQCSPLSTRHERLFSMLMTRYMRHKIPLWYPAKKVFSPLQAPRRALVKRKKQLFPIFPIIIVLCLEYLKCSG